jgi:hypothetical protein
VTFFLKDMEGIKEAMKTLEDFGDLTGLHINKQKSEVMGMGCWTNNIELEDIGLKVVDAMKVTGIIICQDPDRQSKLNFEPIIDKTTKMLNAWKGRNLSIFGKVVAVKAHALSYMQFASSVIAVPDWVIKKMNKIIYSFVWGGPDKIKRVNAALKVEEGGINLPMLKDIITAAQVQWIKRKCKFPHRTWTVFIDIDLQKLGGQGVLIGGLHKKLKLDKCLKYNQDIITAWIELSQNPGDDNVDDIKNVSLWQNRAITDAKNMPMYHPNLSKAGINHVGDLFDSDNKMIDNLPRHNINPNLFLAWMSICKSVPTTWIKAIKESEHSTEQRKQTGIFTKDEYIPIELLTQRKILSILSNKKTLTKNNYNIEMSNRLHINEEEWQFLYKKSINGQYPQNIEALAGDCTMGCYSPTKTSPGLGLKIRPSALSAMKFHKTESTYCSSVLG